MLNSLLAILAASTATVHVGFDDQAVPGWHRGGLRLMPGQRHELPLPSSFSTAVGALAFWVRPDPDIDSRNSFTLMSARWGTASQSYFAISQGWWEPLGSGRLHAVISNQDAAFCSADHVLEPGRWTHVVVSWRASVAVTIPGHCRIYLDGELAANQPLQGMRPHTGRATLALGSDREAADQRGREARATLDEIQYFSTGLGDAQVRALYERSVPDPQQRLRRAFESTTAYRQRAIEPKAETRILLDESWQWARSPADVEALVTIAWQAGFNVIMPCVWHGRGTAWPSERAHRQEELAAPLQEFDPLAHLVATAHRHGIEVHPWFTVVRREDARYPQWSAHGTPEGAFDVHDPGFRTFMADLIGEVATRYPIDGVNLDYIRAMGLCRSARCAQDYASRLHRDLHRDIANSTVLGEARSALETWQDDAVRELVSSIGMRVRESRPAAKITVSGHPAPHATLRPLEGRAEVEWQRRGLIDAVLAMEYGAVPRHDTLAEVAAELGDPAALIWVFANFDRLDGIAVARPAAHLREYVRLARGRVPGSGVAIYLRTMLNAPQIESLARGPFRQRVSARWPIYRADLRQ